MREIKFRAWDHEDKKMWKVIAFSESIWGESEEPNITICDFGKDPTNYETEIRNSTNYELMQYTGLKDKNGREIYEGDILTKVKNSSLDLYVSWCQDECYYDLRSLSGVPFKKLTKNNVIKSEVIGNIYENAELLEEAK